MTLFHSVSQRLRMLFVRVFVSDAGIGMSVIASTVVPILASRSACSLPGLPTWALLHTKIADFALIALRQYMVSRATLDVIVSF